MTRPRVFAGTFIAAWLFVLAFAALCERWYRQTHQNLWSTKEQTL